MRSSDRSALSPPTAGGFSRMIGIAIVLTLSLVTLHGQSSDPATLFQQALRRETLLRQELATARPGASGGVLLERIRVLVGSYEDLARLFAKSESSDDSLSHGGMLAADAFAQFGEASDRELALRLLRSLSARFPASALAKTAAARVKTLETAKPGTALAAAAAAPVLPSAPPPSVPATSTPPPAPAVSANVPPSGPVTLRDIRR